MVGLTISQARNGFFDRPAVIRAVGKAKAAVLSKFGAYVRRSARTLIRPAGKKGAVSRPGEPPRAHVGHLRNRISFAWDLRSQSEVIGPEKFNDIRTGRHQENELWYLSRKPLSRPVRFGQKLSEGAAVSKKNLRLSFSETSAQNPDLPKGASRLFIADVDLAGGAPKARQ